MRKTPVALLSAIFVHSETYGEETNQLSRGPLIIQQKQLFWRKWSMEYLQTLQNRPKWLKKQENFKTGDFV